MVNPLEFAALTQKELAAPDSAVCSVSGTVKADSDDRSFQIMLRHNRSHMSMMMLDPQQGQSRLFPIGCRIIQGVQIAYRKLRLYPKQTAHPIYLFFINSLIFHAVHIAEILTHIDKRPFRQSKGIFQLSSDSQNLSVKIRIYIERYRRVSLGSADHLRLPIDNSGHRIIDPHLNPPLIGNAPFNQRLPPHHGLHLFVILDNRHFRKIGAGYNQRADLIQQQVLGSHTRQEGADEPAPVDFL